MDDQNGIVEGYLAGKTGEVDLSGGVGSTLGNLAGLSERAAEVNASTTPPSGGTEVGAKQEIDPLWIIVGLIIVGVLFGLIAIAYVHQSSPTT